MTETTLLERRTLADQLAENLSKDIAFRRIAPGTRLREVELAKKYSVSRPLVREVLRRLEELGLVEVEPWRGASVPVLTAQELGDLHDFAGQTFAFIARLAARRATPEALEDIDRCVTRMEKISAAKDATPEEYEEARAHVREAVEKASGPIYSLARRRSMMRGLGHQFGLDNVRQQNQRKDSSKRWRKLYELIASGNDAAAFDHTLTMFAATRDAVMDAHAAVHAEMAKS